MKVMCIMNNSIFKKSPFASTTSSILEWRTAAGLRHGVRVEVAHHLLDRRHQGSAKVL